MEALGVALCAPCLDPTAHPSLGGGMGRLAGLHTGQNGHSIGSGPVLTASGGLEAVSAVNSGHNAHNRVPRGPKRPIRKSLATPRQSNPVSVFNAMLPRRGLFRPFGACSLQSSAGSTPFGAAEQLLTRHQQGQGVGGQTVWFRGLEVREMATDCWGLS